MVLCVLIGKPVFGQPRFEAALSVASHSTFCSQDSEPHDASSDSFVVAAYLPAYRLNGLLTIAQAGWQRLGSRVYDSVDRVHLMAYDHDFPQATFEKSKEDVDRVMRDGCPARKLILGLPFYGRDQQRDAMTYADMVKKQKLPSESYSFTQK